MFGLREWEEEGFIPQAQDADDPSYDPVQTVRKARQPSARVTTPPPPPPTTLFPCMQHLPTLPALPICYCSAAHMFVIMHERCLLCRLWLIPMCNSLSCVLGNSVLDTSVSTVVVP